MIFTYPSRRSHRRHGPSGYSAYERFRPWLRDEFDFRCVYCLEREVWTKVVRAFEIDHIAPSPKSPDKSLCYDNLVYSCARCNAVKSDQSVPDPFFELTDASIEINADGKAIGSTRNAQTLIRQLDLNSPTMIEWRKLKQEFDQLAKSIPRN